MDHTVLPNRFLARHATKQLQETKARLAELEQEKIKVTSEIEKLAKEYNNISKLIEIDAELVELQKQKEAKQQEINEIESRWADVQDKRKENINTEWTAENSESLYEKDNELSDKSDQVTEEMFKKYQELSKIQNTITEKQARQRVLLKEIDEQLDKEEAELTKKVIETEAKIQTVENTISRLESILNYGTPTAVGNNGNQRSSGVGPQSSGIGPNVSGMPAGPGEYEYWLKFTDATEETAQYQIEGREAVKKDIDATNGRGVDPAGEAIHIQIFPKRIDLRTRLGGIVWIDEETQKGNTNGELGTKDGNEKPAAKNSVEIVVWKVKYEKGDNTYKEVERKKAIAWLGNENDDGTFAVSRTLNFIDGPEGENYKGRLFINENGEYKIDKIQVPAEQGLDTSKYKIAYDVEFVYDGQTYEATEFLKSTGKDDIAGKVAEFKKTESETAGVEKDYEAYKNDSYIVENAEERKDFDSYFTEVYGDQEMKVESGVSQEDGQTQITATTEGKATGSKGTGNQAKSQYEKVEYGDTTTDVEANLHYESTDITDATTRKTTDLVTHNAQGFILDQYRFAARTSEGGLMYAYENLYHVKKDYYDNFKFQNSLYKPVDEYFTQINLGLVERYPTDISVLKDLYKAKVVVAEQENDYTYNAWGELTEESLNKRVEAGYRTQTYNIGLYNSDYFYRSSVYNTVVDPITKSVLKAIKDDTELRLFVTYRIAITNESEFTDVSINEFKDYYDKSFTLVGSESDKIEGETADTAADKLQTDEDGNMLAYISTSNAKDIAREQKVVAYKPYYRKLKANTNFLELQQELSDTETVNCAIKITFSCFSKKSS